MNEEKSLALSLAGAAAARAAAPILKAAGFRYLGVAVVAEQPPIECPACREPMEQVAGPQRTAIWFSVFPGEATAVHAALKLALEKPPG